MNEMEYHEGDGRVLQEIFKKYDRDNHYLPFDNLTPYQQKQWNRIAEEFLNNIEEEDEL
jgi:hypothetical protein